MTITNYVKASAINAFILCLGIVIGRYSRVPSVNAQTVPTPAPSVWQQEPEYITPGFTVGSAGIGTLLANRVSSDQVMANGYDLLKMQDGILQLLMRKRLATFTESSAIAEGAKVRLIRIKPIPSPAKTQEAPK